MAGQVAGQNLRSLPYKASATWTPIPPTDQVLTGELGQGRSGAGLLHLKGGVSFMTPQRSTFVIAVVVLSWPAVELRTGPGAPCGGIPGSWQGTGAGDSLPSRCPGPLCFIAKLSMPSKSTK